MPNGNLFPCREMSMKQACRRVTAGLFSILILFGAFETESAGSDLAGRVLAEINLARTDPQAFVGFLRDFRSRFRGRSYRVPGSRDFVMTTEGVTAVDEAIRFLSRQKPLPSLAWSAGLAAAAAELVGEEGKSGATGHRGWRSGDPRQRIGRHGEWRGGIGESISYGPDEARLVVMQLIVDDGVPDRGHRRNLYRSSFAMGGVACGPHPVYGTMCVIDSAEWFREQK
jgi:uncharacterized protein YkwD